MKKAIIITALIAILAGAALGIYYLQDKRFNPDVEDLSTEEAEAVVSERLSSIRSEAANFDRIVLINPYHDAEDLSMAEILVNIGLYTQLINEDDKLGIFLTRDNDMPLSNQQIKAYIDDLNPDLFIDIKLSKDEDDQVYGIRGWYCSDYYNYKMTNEDFAEILTRNIAESEVNTVLAIEDINVRDNIEGADCLRDARCPAASISCGYLTGEAEGNLLTTDGYQQTIAWGIYKAIMEALNE